MKPWHNENVILKYSSFHALTLIFSGRAVVSMCVLLGFKFSKFIFILVASGSIRTVNEVVCTTLLCGRGMCGQFIGCEESQAQIVYSFGNVGEEVGESGMDRLRVSSMCVSIAAH